MSDARRAVITTRGLTKQYGRVTAVDAVDLDVRAGDVYGFLGANGSGKTTTVRMLLGLVLPTSGEAEVLGEPMPAARRSVLPQVGALVEGPGAYAHLSGRANLALLDASGRDRSPRQIRGVRIADVLAQVGLDPDDPRPTPARPTCSSTASIRRRRVRQGPAGPAASSRARFSRPERCP